MTTLFNELGMESFWFPQLQMQTKQGLQEAVDSLRKVLPKTYWENVTGATALKVV